MTPVPSIAVLALYKWLQDTHHALQTAGAAFSHQQVLLVVKCWIVVTPAQSPTSRQGSDTAPGASPTSPEAPSAAPGASSTRPEAPSAASGASSISPGASTPALEALSLSPEAATSSPGVGASRASASPPAATSPGAAAAGSQAAAISPGLEVSTAPRQRRSGSGGRQKHAASSLPAVAVKLFGPQYDNARNQDAIVRMVTGCGLPFRCASCSDIAHTLAQATLGTAKISSLVCNRAKPSHSCHDAGCEAGPEAGTCLRLKFILLPVLSKSCLAKHLKVWVY